MPGQYQPRTINDDGTIESRANLALTANDTPVIPKLDQDFTLVQITPSGDQTEFLPEAEVGQVVTITNLSLANTLQMKPIAGDTINGSALPLVALPVATGVTAPSSVTLERVTETGWAVIGGY